MRLKEARESKGLTQTELAQRTGIPQTYLSHQEAGFKDLDLDEMAACERELGTMIEWPSRFTEEQKSHALQAMVSLAERFPLVTVLEFARNTLTDRKDKVPIKTLRFYAAGAGEKGTLPPPEVERKKK